MTEAVLDREQFATFTVARTESTITEMPTRQRRENAGSPLGRRADIALEGLEAGNAVLTIGSNILSDRQRNRLEEQGIAITDESNIAEISDGTQRFDFIIGNIGVDVLDHTLPTIAEVASDHADVYLDVYSQTPFAHNDVLDDTLRQQDLYLRATRAESRKDNHHMQVEAIRNPRGEIAKGIRRGGPYPYRTGPSMETFYAYPGEELK